MVQEVIAGGDGRALHARLVPAPRDGEALGGLFSGRKLRPDAAGRRHLSRRRGRSGWTRVVDQGLKAAARAPPSFQRAPRRSSSSVTPRDAAPSKLMEVEPTGLFQLARPWRRPCRGRPAADRLTADLTGEQVEPVPPPTGRTKRWGDHASLPGASHRRRKRPALCRRRLLRAKRPQGPPLVPDRAPPAPVKPARPGLFARPAAAWRSLPAAAPPTGPSASASGWALPRSSFLIPGAFPQPSPRAGWRCRGFSGGPLAWTMAILPSAPRL